MNRRDLIKVDRGFIFCVDAQVELAQSGARCALRLSLITFRQRAVQGRVAKGMRRGAAVPLRWGLRGCYGCRTACASAAQALSVVACVKPAPATGCEASLITTISAAGLM